MAIREVPRDAHGRRCSHQRHEAIPHPQHERVDSGDEQAHDDCDDVVRVVALEAVGDAAVDAEREVTRDVQPHDEQDPLADVRLFRRDREQVIQVERERDDDRVRHDPDRGEEIEHRARDLVERLAVALRAILGDELHGRAAVPQVEHGEMDGHAGRQHPQAVRLPSEMVQVEREHEQADAEVHEVRQIPRRDVPRDRRERPAVGRRPRRVAFDGQAHAAPFRNSTTFTVSNTIVRSKNTDRCLM